MPSSGSVRVCWFRGVTPRCWEEKGASARTAVTAPQWPLQACVRGPPRVRMGEPGKESIIRRTGWDQEHNSNTTTIGMVVYVV